MYDYIFSNELNYAEHFSLYLPKPVYSLKIKLLSLWLQYVCMLTKGSSNSIERK